MTFSKHVFFYGLAILLLFVPFSIIFLTIGNRTFDIKHEFQRREFTTRNLTLYTHVKNTTSSYVFTDVTSKRRSIRFLKHFFQGKYTFIQHHYFGFSLPLADRDGNLQTDVLAYVIRPLNTSYTQRELYLKLQLLLETKNQTDLKLILPLFDLSFHHIDPIQATTFSLNSGKNNTRTNTTSNEHRATKLFVDGPFYIYLVEAKTKAILGNAFITHLGALLPEPFPMIVKNNQSNVEEKQAKQEKQEKHTPPWITKKLQFLSQTTEIQDNQLRFLDHASNYRMVKFLKHLFSGKYVLKEKEYMAFTLDLVEETQKNQTDYMAYIVQPLRTTDTKDELFIQAKKGFEDTPLKELKLVLPMIDAKLVWLNETIPTLFELRTPTTNDSMDSVTKLAEYRINSPFYLYIVDKKEKKQLADTFIYQPGKFILEENKKTYFDAIIDSSRNLFRTPILDLLGFSPVGVSYIFPFVYSLLNASSPIAKEIVSYMPLDNIKYADSSINNYTQALTNSKDDFGYYLYSPTFQAPGVESKVGKFIQDAEVEHTNDFMNFEKVKLGLHGLHLNYSGLRLDSDAHTFMHYFNLEGWYWSTPFTLKKDIEEYSSDYIRRMEAVVVTKSIIIPYTPDGAFFQAFKLQLQRFPPNNFLENEVNKNLTELSVYIIDGFDKHELYFDHNTFHGVRLRMQNASEHAYKVLLPLFKSFEHSALFDSFQFSAPFDHHNGVILNSNETALVEMALNQTIRICVNENGLGTSRFNRKHTSRLDFVGEIRINTSFYFIIFDEFQETVIAHFYVSKDNFTTDPVDCI